MIDLQTAARLSALAEKAEAIGHLTDEQLDIIQAYKWFKIFVPKDVGGLNFTLPQALELEENLAKIDGSLGWTVTLCAGANLFIGFLESEPARQVFKAGHVCFGGSGAATGIAEITKEGYRVNGRWKYATGAVHLSHFTANCVLYNEGNPLLHADGTPQIRSFFFTSEEVTLHRDWNTMGLKATASHSFSVDHLEVGKERTFLIDEEPVFLPQPIYRYPFLQLAETTLAVNSLGMALHFFEEMALFIENKKKFQNEELVLLLSEKLQEAVHELQTLKTQFYQKVRLSWEQLVEKNKIVETLLKEISHSSRMLSATSRRLVADLYPFCGISATENGTVLNRIFRDIFTASQHSLLNS